MTDINRRSFLATTLASLGLATSARDSRLSAFAQAGGTATPNRIDVHHHFAPPAWVAEVKGRPLLQTANTTWTPAKSIDDMDRGGVAAAMISITNPGLWFGDKAATNRLARACNEYGAKLVQDHPTRFGLFAAMPLPDVDATLEGDRVRLRYAQGRRRRPAHELRRHLAGQSRVQAGDGGTQPAESGRPRSSDGRQLLQEPRLRRGAGDH